MPELSVVIPAYNAEATLPATLAALAAQRDAPPFEVIVIDDGSTDGTAAAIAAAPLPVRTAPSTGKGPAAARNRGAALATGRVLAFTDADCTPDPGWLAAGLAAIDAGAGLVQGRVLPPPGVRVGPFDRHITVLSEYGLYETANLFMVRERFAALGGFESILLPRDGKELGEDVWLGWRARRAGVRTAFCDAALVHHVVFPRGPLGYAAERARLRFFPEMARRIPELRDAFFHRRVFLNERSLRFDLAVAGVAGAAVTRRVAPLALTVPYARLLLATPPRVAGGHLAADVVGAAALAFGSLRSRSLLI